MQNELRDLIYFFNFLEITARDHVYGPFETSLAITGDNFHHLCLSNGFADVRVDCIGV